MGGSELIMCALHMTLGSSPCLSFPRLCSERLFALLLDRFTSHFPVSPSALFLSSPLSFCLLMSRYLPVPLSTPAPLLPSRPTLPHHRSPLVLSAPRPRPRAGLSRRHLQRRARVVGRRCVHCAFQLPVHGPALDAADRHRRWQLRDSETEREGAKRATNERAREKEGRVVVVVASRVVVEQRRDEDDEGCGGDSTGRVFALPPTNCVSIFVSRIFG